MHKVEKLEMFDLHNFWLLFKEMLETEFPGYSKETVRIFLEKLYSEAIFKYFFEQNIKTILVIKDKTQIAGFAVIDEPYGGVSLLRWLGVKKEFQKKGLGSELISAWKELALQQGCHKIEVAAQPEAKNFYEKVGLNLEGHRIKSYFGIDQYIFGNVLK